MARRPAKAFIGENRELSHMYVFCVHTRFYIIHLYVAVSVVMSLYVYVSLQGCKIYMQFEN